MKSENNELAKEFAVWCWGKEVSSDVSKIESLFSTFLAEKEKDYEILSFICIKKDRRHVFNEIRYIESHRTDSYLYSGSSVANGDWAIHSVKRLSDGEIFALGDTVENINNPIRYKGKINKIQTLNNVNFTITYSAYNYYESIQKVKHSKSILFTTLDGIIIFEGDSYFYLDCNLTSVFACTIADKDFRPPLSFSTPIAAKNYKTENEKRYSFSDIRTAFKNHLPYSIGETMDKTILKFLE